jgi:hypothetical protein
MVVWSPNVNLGLAEATNISASVRSVPHEQDHNMAEDDTAYSITHKKNT